MGRFIGGVSKSNCIVHLASHVSSITIEIESIQFGRLGSSSSLPKANAIPPYCIPYVIYAT
jgi:hypothetical protein